MKPPLTSHTHTPVISLTNVLLRVATLKTNMLECSHHYCHMTQNMLELSYGNERKMNDGGRVTPVAQRAWVESLQAQETRTRVLLCSQVEAGRNLHHVTNQVANDHQRGSTEENTGFLRGKQNELTLSVAEPRLSSFQALCLDSCLRYLIADSTPKQGESQARGGWKGNTPMLFMEVRQR
jgi:hypothetical protein